MVATTSARRHDVQIYFVRHASRFDGLYGRRMRRKLGCLLTHYDAVPVRALAT